MLKNKTVLITGAGAGIGRTLALSFAAHGASVILLDCDSGAADAVAAEIRQSGGCAISVAADVSSAKELDAAFGQIAAATEKLDVLVNCAGIYVYKNALTLDESEWDECLDVDLKGAWLCSKLSIPMMIRTGGGSIVNIASTHALRAQGNAFPYNVAKAGLLALTQSLAADFGPKGIRVNAVCPGLVLTASSMEYFEAHDKLTVDQLIALQPLPVHIGADDVANSVLFLASDMARCISGAALVIDAGRTTFLNVRHGD